MNFRTLTACAVVAASSVLSTQAHAQPITDSFTYQGELNDGGAPANGLYDITFVVYDTPFFGTIVSESTVSDVEVVDGRFEAFVDFGTSGVTFDSTNTRWMQLRITEAGQPGFTALAPRQRMSPTPIANYALRSGFASSSGNSLQDVYDNGQSIFANAGAVTILGNAFTGVDPILQMGTSGVNTGNARIDMYQNNGNRLQTLGREFFTGSGEHIIYESDGDTAIFASGSSGGGGFLSVSRGESLSGIRLEGDAGQSSMSIFGDFRSINFDTGAANADGSVSLPTGSINSSELANEVGASASANGLGTITLTPDSAVVDVIESVTINAPRSGYVFVIASFEATAAITQTNLQVLANFGVSTSTTSFPSNADIELRYPANSPIGEYDTPVTVHGFFPVGSGSNTFNLLGDQNSDAGVFQAFDIQLTAIYIPTLYGTSSITSGTNIPDEFAPAVAPMSDLDILRQRDAALQADNDRLQREVDEMKAQMQQLMEQSDREFRQRTQD